MIHHLAHYRLVSELHPVKRGGSEEKLFLLRFFRGHFGLGCGLPIAAYTIEFLLNHKNFNRTINDSMKPFMVQRVGIIFNVFTVPEVITLAIRLFPVELGS